MSQRKKRLFAIVAGVILCCAAIWLAGEYAQINDREEYAKKCKMFEGIWRDDDRHISLEIHRVSSGTLFFSIINRTLNREVRLMNAYAVGDDMYEFSYSTNAGKSGRVYQITAGTEGKGRIHLLDDQIKVEIPEIPGKKKGLEYTGILTQKKPLPEQKVHHLAEYLGTKAQMEKELARYCSFYYDADGKIWRVHAMLAEESEIYKTDILGISMNSSEQECRSILGELSSETKLGDRGWRKQYENSQYVSTVITNSFGVITEIDCQIAELPGAVRQGDFIMKGDTLYRYAGDYSQTKTIELPKETKRIASHAFDAGEHGYTVSTGYRYISNIDIPAGIKVEEDAFTNCGPMKIYLKSGWTEIPEGAFAHTVSMENVQSKGNWVEFILPSTLKKIGARAFALGESEEELESYWEKIGQENDPVSVRAPGWNISFKDLTYIGDDAFWGIAMYSFPGSLEYLGTNYTIRITDSFETIQLPSKLERLKKGNIYIAGQLKYYSSEGNLTLPADIKEIEDGAVWMSLGIDNFGFTLPHNAKHMVTMEKDARYSNPEWILSKDKKILYAIAPDESWYDDLWYDDDDDWYDDDDDDWDDDEDDWDDDEDDWDDDEDDWDDDEDEEGTSRSRYSSYGGMYRPDQKKGLVLDIPKGIEEIRSYANMRQCDVIDVPKSVKKISVEAFFIDGAWSEIIFRGKVPELYGDLTPMMDEDGYIKLGNKKIQVKKDQKEKLLKQLMGDKKYPKEKKKELASRITTF